MPGRVPAVIFLLCVRVPRLANHYQSPLLFTQSQEALGIRGFYEHAFPGGSDCTWEGAGGPVATGVNF